MKIFRSLHAKLVNELTVGNKGIVLYGPRQVGKTTLINDVIADVGVKALKSWIKTYPDSTVKIINRNNWQEFV